MNPYVTWAAAMVCVVCGLLSTWVLRQRPRWSMQAAAVGAGASVVVVANEALRTGPTAYVGVWVLILATTFMNWSVCRRSERDHHRRVAETLELLSEMARVQRNRARLMSERGVGIYSEPPPKEC